MYPNGQDPHLFLRKYFSDESYSERREYEGKLFEPFELTGKLNGFFTICLGRFENVSQTARRDM